MKNKLKAAWRKIHMAVCERVDCEIHGEVRQHVFARYGNVPPCEVCGLELLQKVELEEYERRRDARIAEYAAAVRQPAVLDALIKAGRAHVATNTEEDYDTRL